MTDDLYTLVTRAKHKDKLAICTLRLIAEAEIQEATGKTNSLNDVPDDSIIELFNGVLTHRANCN